ncbi:MAG: acyl-CoA dehydrogenase family protein [Acidimicrobiales bacterium]
MTTSTLLAPALPTAPAAPCPVRPDLRPSPTLLAAVAAGATHADRTATLVPAHDQMVTDGLFHLLVPPELGGAGATIIDWFDAAYEIARADASAAWLMAQGAVQTAVIAVSASDELVGQFFSARQTLASTSAGVVTAERHGDRYRLRNARWPYASGSSGAAYLGGLIASLDPDGKPELRMALVPASHAVIEPTWDTLGLRGTASHHINFGAEVHIPAAMTYTWPALSIERPGTLATAISYVGWMISLSAAATNLGVARHAIDAANSAAANKQRRFDSVSLAQQPPFLRGVAELHGTVDLAVAGLRALLDNLWNDAAAGIDPSPRTRARLRLAAARAVSMAADVVLAAQGLVGADALHRSSELERLGRDSQMLLHHISVNPSTREQLAQALAGTYQGPPGLI